jgi:sugar phosphate isomerase/epimerase
MNAVFLNAALTATAAAEAANAAWPAIRLSLSGRISEPIGDVPNLKPLTYDEFLAIARGTGYSAICLRPLQCSISTPLEEMEDMARRTREAGLQVSMVTCDNDQPPNNDRAPFALLNITPRLTMAQVFGAKLIRCQIKKPEHLGWAQRACDEAKERGLSIVHLSHPATLFSNVADAIDCLKKINRPNFGLTYEPVNWMNSPGGYGRDVIRSVAPWTVNVYAQNQKTGSDGGAANNLALWEPGGIDFDVVFQGLHETGYTGYFTVHSRASLNHAPRDLATRSLAFLKPYSEGVRG